MDEAPKKESAQKWKDELKRYSDAYEDFDKRGSAIVRRYIDDRKEGEKSQSRFNILWSNVRTLKPAIYSRPPSPEVSRRFKDQNPIARVASLIIERALSYEITQFSDYHSALTNAVEDRLLPGRGVAWIRYEPVTEQIEDVTLTDDVEADGMESGEASLAGEEPLEQITGETTPVDYVYWKDFAHLPARTWEEVTWVARRVYLGKDEGVERFGETFAEVPRNYSPDKTDEDKETTKELKKAMVWEIWSKPDEKVYWMAEGYEYLLDTRPDPLELENFFPCPKPIFATITTGSICPTADFILYQDQADEVDELTQRIRALTESLRVRGVYAAEEKELATLLSDAKDGEMIPISNWNALAEKGGIQNLVQFLPLKDIVFTLGELYKAREACKQIIYETTGISDILRGASQASETLGAQQIKAQYASLRLNDMKDDVARFARDLLRMKAEVMCSKYQPRTLADMSGVLMTPDAQYAEQAIALLKNDTLRNFSIDIENDTLVQIDEQSEKQSRIEFLTAVGGFIEKAAQVGKASPLIGDLLGEMLLFGVRGFKIGRAMESTIENTLENVKKAAQEKQGQPSQPSPEQIKMQADQQDKQAELQHASQLKQMDMQKEVQIAQAREQAESQRENMRLQASAQERAADRAMDQWKAELDASTQITIAGISAQKDAEQAIGAAIEEVVSVLGENNAII